MRNTYYSEWWRRLVRAWHRLVHHNRLRYTIRELVPLQLKPGDVLWVSIDEGAEPFNDDYDDVDAIKAVLPPGVEVIVGAGLTPTGVTREEPLLWYCVECLAANWGPGETCISCGVTKAERIAAIKGRLDDIKARSKRILDIESDDYKRI